MEEEGFAETLVKVFAKAEEAAGEREERMRRLELEAEERRMEAEDRREEQMMQFLAGIMQSAAGGYAHPPYQQGRFQPPGVRPIGVCEAARRIIAKAVLSTFREDILEASGALQLCGGQVARVEAAIHAIRSCFARRVYRRSIVSGRHQCLQFP